MSSILPYMPTTVAEAIASFLDEAAAARGRATLAIPGGRSPGPVLTALAGILTPFVRQRLHLLWLDERAVPVGHPDRNDLPTLAAWQQGGDLPAHVHPMPAESADLDAAADLYAHTLATATGGDPIDVCLIGIGEDGHFASLFPQHPGLSDLGDVFVIRDSPKPPAARLSLGLVPIVRARQRLVLALGAAKGDMARRSRIGADRAVPVSLLPAAGTVWYLDDAAAARLNAAG
jgi:6-phosphogluconolactonase